MSPQPEERVSLQPAPRRKLSETVAQQLMDAFADLPPGAKVPSERELTRDLGVGRSTVREALNGLAVLGVLEIRHGQGAFIADHGPTIGKGEELAQPSSLTAALERGVTREFIEARLLVEVKVAGLAAERRTEDDLRQMEAALKVQEERLRDDDGDLEAVVGVASSFNMLIAEAAHNEVLAAMIESFVELMKERGPRLYALPDFGDWDLKEHRGIYEAVRDQNPERASELMREHILQLAGRYREIGAG
jgi:GntR family transcriptional repressor for pyruvate dehydrogenase complex